MSRSRLGDFDIMSRLGAGSFGTVYKVKRIVDEKVYVMKMVRIAELSNREQTDAINEVQILAQMKSPYVVCYYDSFIEKDSLHIVMEFCNRGDLQNLLKKAKERSVMGLKENVVWNMSLQIMLGLYYLHKKNILHRDLKTANVFLTKDGSNPNYALKIGDLGVAKLMDTSTALAKTIVGTPYYLSPELCKDMPYRDKSDCWALGVLIYECCTLIHPFEANNQCALIMKIIEAPVSPPPSSTTSPVLTNLILWLLQKDPRQRPSVKDLFNEREIRQRLREHHLDLPEELESERQTNYLVGGIVGAAVSDDTSMMLSSGEVRDAFGSGFTGQTRVINGAAAAPVAGNGSVRQPTGLIVRVPSTRRQPSNPNVNNNITSAVTGVVSGDRVRGPRRAMPSEKARSRYQLNRAPSTSTRTTSTVGNVSSAADEKEYQQQQLQRSMKDIDIKDSDTKDIDMNDDKDDDGDYEPDFEEYDDNGPQSNNEQTSPDTKDAPPRINYDLKSEPAVNIAEGKSNGSSHDDSDIHNMSMQQRSFKPLPSDSNDPHDPHHSTAGSSFHIPRSLQSSSDMSFAPPHMATGELLLPDNEAEMWSTMWSERRGHANIPGGHASIAGRRAVAVDGVVYEDPNEDVQSPTAEIYPRPDIAAATVQVEQPVQQEMSQDQLAEMIDVAKSRAIEELGSSLYRKVYDLLSRHMHNTSENAEDRMTVLQELNDVLESEGSIEAASDAVFRVKALLAFESKYTDLVRMQGTRRAERKDSGERREITVDLQFDIVGGGNGEWGSSLTAVHK